MAEWKKIIVSGSDAHLASVTASNLTNDELVIAGTGGALESTGLSYDGSSLDLTGATGGVSGSFSGSFQGDGSQLTGVAATSFDIDSLSPGTTIEGGDQFIYSDGGTESKLAFSVLSSSLYQGVSGDATIAADGALTIAATAVEGTMLNSNVADGTTIQLASNELSVLKVPNALTEGSGIADFSFDGSAPHTVAVSGAAALSTNIITKWTGDAFVDSSLTDDGTDITGASSIQLTGASSNLSGSFSGSFFGDGSGLTGTGGASIIAGDAADNQVAVFNSTNTIDGYSTFTFNDTTKVLTVDGSGSFTGDLSVGNNLTVTGDLTVQGTTTTLSTTNLLVEDRFALLNSGSATGDGGIIVQTEADGSGTALGWDDNVGRFGLQIGTKLAQNASTIASDAYIASVVTSADATYEKNGNIRVEGGDIFIYVE